MFKNVYNLPSYRICVSAHKRSSFNILSYGSQFISILNDFITRHLLNRDTRWPHGRHSKEKHLHAIIGNRILEVPFEHLQFEKNTYFRTAQKGHK
jgi:hypothetical protein